MTVYQIMKDMIMNDFEKRELNNFHEKLKKEAKEYFENRSIKEEEFISEIKYSDNVSSWEQVPF
jgi:hypothetical protein